MNVLGPYSDDKTKISEGYVVLKVGKPSYNAASRLGLKAAWPRSRTTKPG